MDLGPERDSGRGPLLEFNEGSHPGDSTHYVPRLRGGAGLFEHGAYRFTMRNSAMMAAWLVLADRDCTRSPLSVSRLSPHSAHTGTNIHLGSLAGGACCGTGRRKRPGRPLEQTEKLFGNKACP